MGNVVWMSDETSLPLKTLRADEQNQPFGIYLPGGLSKHQDILTMKIWTEQKDTVACEKKHLGRVICKKKKKWDGQGAIRQVL